MCITVYISLQVYFKCIAYKSARFASLKLAVDAQPNTIIFAYTFPFCPLLSIYGPCILYTLKTKALLCFTLTWSNQVLFLSRSGLLIMEGKAHFDTETEPQSTPLTTKTTSSINISVSGYQDFVYFDRNNLYINYFKKKKLYGSFALP